MVVDLEQSKCSHDPVTFCGFLSPPFSDSSAGKLSQSGAPDQSSFLIGSKEHSEPSAVKYHIGLYSGAPRTFVDLTSRDTLSPEHQASQVAGKDTGGAATLPLGVGEHHTSEISLDTEDKISAYTTNSISIECPPLLGNDHTTGTLSKSVVDEELLVKLPIAPTPISQNSRLVDVQKQVLSCKPIIEAAELPERSTDETSPHRSSGIIDIPVFDRCALETVTQDYDDLLPDTQVGAWEENGILFSSEDPLLQVPQAPIIEPLSHNNTSTSEVTQSIVNSESPEKIPHNKLTCRQRKRIAIPSNRPPKLTTAMQLWIRKTNNLLDPFREDDDCWLHPSPPPARLSANGTLRPCGKLQKAFTWTDRNGKHTIVLNYGIVSKLAYHTLSKQQQDGFINKAWHLSHLCGNWVCLNPAHTTVEPGSVNISRNNCFSHRSGCPHHPPCMKERKISLDAHGKPVDHNLPVEYEVVLDEEWDDWMLTGDDEVDFGRGESENWEDREAGEVYVEEDEDEDLFDN